MTLKRIVELVAEDKDPSATAMQQAKWCLTRPLEEQPRLEISPALLFGVFSFLTLLGVLATLAAWF
jgi:hypothetical protein